MLTLPSSYAPPRQKQKIYGDNEKFWNRINKTFCYGKFPRSDRTSLPVTELAAELFSHAKHKLSLDLLDVEEAARLSRRASVSPCSLVLALIYLDRLKASNPKYLAKVPPSQLFLISLMVGSKFMQDDGQNDEVNNCEWAVHAGLTVQDINRAEKEFLDAIQWEVFVSTKAFWRRLEATERVIALRQGVSRGWFSYTELDLLLKSTQLAALIKTLFNISVLCMTSYTASAFAVFGSTILITQLSPGMMPLITPSSPTAPAHTTLSMENNTQIFKSEELNTLPANNQELPAQNYFSRCLLDRFISNGTQDCILKDETVSLDRERNDWSALWPIQQHSENSWALLLQRYFIQHEVISHMIQISF